MHRSQQSALAILSTLFLACGATDSGDDDATDSSGSAATGESTDASTGVAADPYACVETMRMALGPLAGPGYDPENGLIAPLQDTYYVHSTQILIKPEQLARFGELLAEVQVQLQTSEGLAAYTGAQDVNCGWVRTLGIWRSEEAMYKFVTSGAHLAAMSETAAISYTGKATHWKVDASALPPTWEDAEARLGAIDPLPLYQ
jgi:quinol monooxygenase YgiN